MGEVNITINGRSFKLGCDDGEEQHLLVLADHLGKHVENLSKTIGKAGDEQLFLMAGLMVCDELWDTRDLLLKAEALLKRQAGQVAKKMEKKQPDQPVKPLQKAQSTPDVFAPPAQQPQDKPQGSENYPSAGPVARPSVTERMKTAIPKESPPLAPPQTGKPDKT